MTCIRKGVRAGFKIVQGLHEFGAMEGGGPVAAWFSVLTDVHLFPENGVLEEGGQQTGSEVNVRVPCQEQELGT